MTISSFSIAKHRYRRLCLVVFIAQSLAYGQSPSGTRAAQLPLSGRQASGITVRQSAPAPSGASSNIQIQVQGNYSGSIPALDAMDKLELTLAEAIRRGLSTNLGVVSSSLSVEQARAQVADARSALLPAISAHVAENAATVNLAAQGFSADAFGGGALGAAFPATVGPFHYYDLHGALQQSLLDVTAIRNLKAKGKLEEAARLQSRQSREEVVLAVTGVYLQLMADLALVDRQRAEVSYAEVSYRQAAAQSDAGNKAPIEASRSLVELQTEQQRLRAQLGESAKRQIQLARLIGLPLQTQLHPQEHLEALAGDSPTLEEMMRLALAQRQDLKAAEAQLRSAEQVRKAAVAERLPTAALSGTYGVQGKNPNQGNMVFQASVVVSVPIYQGGRIAADVSQADVVVRQRRAELTDQRGSVESDVRTAYIDLQVANDQVVLAESNRKLATETLQQSQDRFAVGVADSVEVVNSQQALAAADHDYVNSMFSQHVARITLAHAMGEAEQQIPHLFERKSQ